MGWEFGGADFDFETSKVSSLSTVDLSTTDSLPAGPRPEATGKAATGERGSRRS